ncbi:MAG: glycosyltransferase [Nitrospirota bacterium]|nr:glycosyltransferase [Nitrospirota bacterium]
MSGSLPRISIVTPCLNRRDFVAEAIESLLAQDYPNFEHIVMDGGSTDGTLEVLAKYPHLKVVSEPDDGLYDAINKGIARATGEWVGLLNTDDRYASGAFKLVADYLSRQPNLDMVSGAAVVWEQQGTHQKELLRYAGAERLAMAPEMLAQGAVVINARFFRRAFLDTVGGFDTSFPVASDRDLLLRAALLNPNHACLDGDVYHYLLHGGSISINRSSGSVLPRLEEDMGLAEKYLEGSGFPASFRRVLQKAHSRFASDAVNHALRSLRLFRAIGYAMRGLRFNPLWPLAFLRNLGTAVRRGLGKMYV